MLHFSDNSTSEELTCVPYHECDWSKKIVERAKILKSPNGEKRRLINFVKERICDNQKKYVYCDIDQMPPSYNSVQISKGIYL